MALPWLIGALIVSAGAAIAKSISDDNEREKEAQRIAEREREKKAEIERERIKKEHEKKLQSAHENFLLRGERIGSDISQILQGWIRIEYEKNPAFTVTLEKNGLSFRNNLKNQDEFEDIFSMNEEIFYNAKKNLNIYSKTYAVNLKQDNNLTKATKEISDIEKELNQINQLKKRIFSIKTKALENA